MIFKAARALVWCMWQQQLKHQSPPSSTTDNNERQKRSLAYHILIIVRELRWFYRVHDMLGANTITTYMFGMTCCGCPSIYKVSVSRWASAVDANAQAINPIGIDTCPHFYTIFRSIRIIIRTIRCERCDVLTMNK